MKEKIALFSDFFLDCCMSYREIEEDLFYFDFAKNKLYACISFDECELFKRYSIKMSEISRNILKDRFNIIPFFRLCIDDCMLEYLKTVKVGVEELERFADNLSPCIMKNYEGSPEANFRNIFRIYEEEHPSELERAGGSWIDFFNKTYIEGVKNWIKDNPDIKIKHYIYYDIPKEETVKDIALAVRPDINANNINYVPVENSVGFDYSDKKPIQWHIDSADDEKFSLLARWRFYKQKRYYYRKNVM